MSLDTLAEIRTEFLAYGFDYLEQRANELLSDSYLDICEDEDWPFLEATTSGTAPLTIADLRTIEYVTDNTQRGKLTPLDRRNLTDTDYSLTTAGSPYHYYVTSGTIVNTYPVSTSNTIAVAYWKVPDPLEDDSDVPLMPARFRRAIIHGAREEGYLDSDNLEAAMAAATRKENIVQRMRETLLEQQHDQPDDFILSTAGAADA